MRDRITTPALDPARIAMVKGRPVTCRILAEGYANAGYLATSALYSAMAEEAERAQKKEPKP